MKRLLLIFSIAAGLTIIGCGSGESDHSHGEETHTHETEEHAHDEGTEAAHQHEGEEEHTHSEATEDHSHSGEEAHSHEEESDPMLDLDETYEEVRKGVRLTLSYSGGTDSFTGTIENTTQDALPQVSVGVELSNGTELGPTDPVDLESGESQSVELGAAGETFDSWTAHSELGSGGHSHGEDGDHEHHN